MSRDASLSDSHKSVWQSKWKSSFLSVKRLSDRKNVTDRLIAVRETGVSRHQGGPIEGPPETPLTSQHYHIEGINYVKENGNIVTAQ